jgi:hypothetical protein
MAQTLKFGNGTWATKKGSTLAYNDEGGNFKPLPFTYTGAGKGTRVNKEGLIEVVENDRPRIDYKDSEDGVFLLEKAATNLVTYSNDFSQSIYGKINLTITANQGISPDGTQNANLLVPNSSVGNRYLTNSTGSNLKTNTVFLKKKELRYVKVGNAQSNVLVDLENGTISASSVSTNNFTIENYGSGWYRVSCHNTLDVNLQIQIFFGIDGGGSSIATNGTDGVYIYGFQLESGNVASSYIPTQGTIQTRVQETASGSGNSEVFNDSQGVLYINTAALSNDGTNRQISISNGGTTERVYFGFRANSNEFILSSRDSSYLIANVSDVTNFNKYVFQYKSGNFKAFVNGFNYTLTADGGLLPTGLNTLNFNDGAGGADYFGKTKELAYYDEVLTDLELETLTSYRTWEEMVNELNLNIIHNE